MLAQLDQLMQAQTLPDRCSSEGKTQPAKQAGTYPCKTFGAWTVVQSENFSKHWYYKSENGYLIRRLARIIDPEDRRYLDFDDLLRSM